jgi:hypothetical protein
LCEELLSRAEPCALILEYQGQAHHPDTRVMGGDADAAMIIGDLERARALWRRYRPACSLVEQPREAEALR